MGKILRTIRSILPATMLFVNAVFAQKDTKQLMNTFEKGKGETIQILLKIWNFELFVIKDQPVYVNQVVLAIIMFSLGIIVSRWLTHRVKNYLGKKTRLDENSIVFLQRITFYILIVILVLSTLQMMHVPITMFAFLGGAIIIGIGFGAQQIFSNFFSGIILMIERPVRIGDIIEVESHLGIIEDIGARCTRMRRFDGIEVLIPNSKLLENNVVNRTLSDRRYRTTVTVGVAYGSPIEKVAEIIRNIALNHPDILTEPKPEVFFQDFGDSALLFEVFFWIEVNMISDIRRIRSDLRFRIDKEFREQKITIAFPQQDTHIDTRHPIEVKVINPDKE